jgi:phosphoglycerate dehydrogenase-like enzyme
MGKQCYDEMAVGSVKYEDARVRSVVRSNLCGECASRAAEYAVRRTYKSGRNMHRGVQETLQGMDRDHLVHGTCLRGTERMAAGTGRIL